MTSIRTFAVCLMTAALAATASGQIILSANPSALVFSAQPGGASQALNVTVNATSPVDISISYSTVTGGAWLQAAPATARTPVVLFVLATPGSLLPGPYTGVVTITAPGAGNSPLQVPVTMNVGSGGSTQLAATPSSVSFSYTVGGSVPASQNLLVSSATASQVNFTATVATASGINWLTLNAAGGTTPVNLAVGVNPASVGPGTHTGTITLTPSGGAGGSLQVPVTLAVTGTPQLSANPASLTFQYQIGTTAPGPKTVSIASGGVAMPFTAFPETTSGGSWLLVSPYGGSTPSDLAVSVNPAALAVMPVGTYYGKITVSASQASNSPLNISVTLVIGNNPFLTVTPETLSFDMAPGGALPAGKNLSVGSTGTALPFSAAGVTTTPSGVNWLSLGLPGALTPTVLPVSINSAALTLPPGTYNGTVTLSTTIFGVPTVTVPVTLTVSGAPALVLSPPSLTFNYQSGKLPPPIQSVEVKSSGVPVSFNAAVTQCTGGNWLVLDAASGTTPATIRMAANPAGLAAGATYQCTVTFTPAAGGAAQNMQVSLNVSSTPLLSVSPASLAFDFVLGVSEPKYKELALASTDTAAALNFTVEVATSSGGTNWLAVFPLTGGTPANLTVYVWAASLPLGTHSGTITVRGTNANTVTISVTVTVTSGANLAASPTSLTFTQALGGTPAPPQKLTVTSTGGNVRYTALATTGLTPTWLVVTPSTGTTPGEVSATVDATRVPQPGTYYGSITFQSPEAANSPLNIQVTFTLGAAQTLAVSPTTLQFSHQAGGAAPAAQKVTVTSTGGSLGFTATGTTDSGGNWLGLGSASGNTPADVTVTVAPAGLQPGTYNGRIAVSSPNASNSPQLVSVTLTVTAPPPPQPVLTKVVNAASYAPGALALGQIVYLEGTSIGPPTLTTLRVTGGRVDSVLGDTRILFDGMPAALVYVSATKCSAVVPYSLLGRASTRVQVEYQNVRSNSLEFRLADAAPGLFAANASGQGPGAILNQDYSVNGPNAPAAKGSVVMLYGTGEGQVMPLPADGFITPSAPPWSVPALPVTALIGGRPARVLYAGPAPGYLAGLLQVNVLVPEDAPSGAAVPVTVIVGGTASQAGLTLAVR